MLKLKNNLRKIQGPSFNLRKIQGPDLRIFVYWIYYCIHERLDNQYIIPYFSPLLICLMINYDINKDLNISLSFPDEATALTLKNNLRITLGSKLEKFKNIEARRKLFLKESVNLLHENKIPQGKTVGAKWQVMNCLQGEGGGSHSHICGGISVPPFKFTCIFLSPPTVQKITSVPFQRTFQKSQFKGSLHRIRKLDSYSKINIPF